MKPGSVISKVYGILLDLHCQELSVMEVAKLLNEDPLVINGSLNSLENKGLIERSSTKTPRGGKKYIFISRKRIKIKLSTEIWKEK